MMAIDVYTCHWRKKVLQHEKMRITVTMIKVSRWIHRNRIGMNAWHDGDKNVKIETS